MGLNRTSMSKVMPSELDESFRVQFRVSRYIICLIQTSEWKAMNTWISRELLLFNFECLHKSCASIVHPCQKLWLSELDQSFRVQFQASTYIKCLNWTSELTVMTIWIFREYPLFDFKPLDTSWPQSYTHVKSYGRLNWTTASVLLFECLDILCGWNGHPSEMLSPFEFLENFHFSISSVSIYHGPQSYTHVKS